MDGERVFSEPFDARLRLIVCSDVHLRGPADARRGRLKTALETAIRVAEKDANHPALDGVVFVGDLTDHGTKDEYICFFDTVKETLGGRIPVFSVLAKNHDNWEHGRASVKTGLRYYREITGRATDFHETVGGFHLIGLSTSDNDGEYYADAQKAWLRNALEEASADAPGRPVFVFTHEHIPDTVFGSAALDGWAHSFFSGVFDAYPHAVCFSGHSHYPLNDPRSIWRGAYTAVGTGAMSYAELSADGVRKLHPPGSDEISQGWILEADGRNRVRLTGCDFLSGDVLCRYLIDPAAPLPIHAPSGVPAFPDSAAITAEKTDGKLRLSFPAAKIADSTPVMAYRIVLSAEGEDLRERLVIPPYWRSRVPETLRCTFENVPPRGRIAAYAQNAYGAAGGPLTYEWTPDQT